jgi:hypothetical protein
VIQTATIVLPTGRLTASAVDLAGRTIEGILVPFGEVGQPAIDGEGRRVSIRRGGLTLADQVTGLDTHDRPKREVSRLDRYEIRAEGIWGRLAVDPTPAGDQLLAQVAEGKRLGLSVEANGLLLDPGTDQIVGGVVDAVAHVDDPAFPSARVHSMAAALAPVPSPEGAPLTEPTPTPAAAPAPVFDYAALAAALAPQLSAAVAPAGLGLPSTPAPAPAAQVTEPAPSVERLASLQASVMTGDSTMRAALEDITNSDLPIFQRPAGEIPTKLWSNTGYTRRWVNLLNPKPLTSYKVKGWEWKYPSAVQVGDYTGDKAEIPTSPGPETVEVEATAQRIAGGWDIDRKFRDFGDTLFWTEFYAQQTESYARKTDAKALAALLAATIDITDGTPTLATQDAPRFTKPAGWTPAAQADVLRAVAYGTAYLEDTPLIEQSPDYVLMNTADWLGLLDITNLDVPAFLNLIGVQPGSFLRSSQVPAGSIILGVRKAVDFYELPGAAPIRVEALDVARAGIDSAVYGYWATLNVRPGGIISVPLAG